jgi:glyoxylase-like metal-dependent hydrolase (beta-lactamase superfamily II)
MAEPEMTPEAEASLAGATELGIHAIPVPTPFAVGRVNCYLLEGDPLTLIDAGPKSDRSLEFLENGIKAAGFTVEDIELVVSTHQHIDHIGLIGTVAERSGAEVAAIDISVDRLASYTFGSERDDQMAVDLMIRNGVPAEIANALKEVTKSFQEWGSPVTVTKPVTDGGTLVMGSREYEVFLRPGHSPSDTLFWDAERKLMFGGDHLLSHISSNPLISKPLVGEGERTRALIDYRESLAKTKADPIELMLSGHGLPITHHVDLIDKRIASQDRRTEKILDLVADGHSKAHSIADAIWGNIALTQAYLTLSEVVGHLDILIDEGRVSVSDDGEFDRFEAIA